MLPYLTCQEANKPALRDPAVSYYSSLLFPSQTN